MTKFQQKIWPFEKFVAKYVFFFKFFKISICDIHRKNKHIFKIQCWCSLILSEIPIFGNFYLSFLFQKIKIVCWSWKLEPRLIWTCRIWWWFSFFLFHIANTFFGQICSKKIQIVCWSWKFEHRLFRISQIYGDVHFFCFRLFFCKFCPKHSFGIINRPAVYFQGLEASGIFYS